VALLNEFAIRVLIKTEAELLRMTKKKKRKTIEDLPLEQVEEVVVEVVENLQRHSLLRQCRQSLRKKECKLLKITHLKARGCLL
jgi:hypothetical protein